MSSASDLHDRAMALADEAEAAKRAANQERARELALAAMQLEEQAAMLLLSKFDQEPTRSVLFRSAAALAVDAGELVLAERFIGLGLGGTPPTEIGRELRDLLEHVTFSRHLELRGVELEPEEVQMSIAGPAVDYGMASSDDFVGRVKVFEKWIKQTAERKARLLEWSQERIQSVKRELGVYLSIPRPASFAVSMRVGRPSAQQLLRFDSFESGLIDEILDEIELVNEGKEDELASRVGNSEVKTVIGFAKAIAPNDEGIRTVGFTTVRSGKERQVAFRRVRASIRLNRPGKDSPDSGIAFALPPPVEQLPVAAFVQPRQLVEVTGYLRYADGMQGHSVLRLVTPEGRVHDILVPPPLMDAIVRPHWAEMVTISGYYAPEGIEFEDIRPVG